MKIKSKILFLALVFSAYCCSPKGDGSISIVNVGGNNVAVFSLNELKSSTVDIPISSLVEGCEMIQLDNRDEALLSTLLTTTISEKYIGFRAMEAQTYKLFDRSGKFLCNVGAVGRGPGEYAISIYDDIIDDNNELIYIAPYIGNNILVYNTSGKFLKNLEAPHRLQKPKIFLFDNILTVVHVPLQGQAIAIQFNVNTGEVVNQLAPPAHFISKDIGNEINNTRNMSAVFDFFHSASDTLYHFDVKNNKILPVLTTTYTGAEQALKLYIQLNKELFMVNVHFFTINSDGKRQNGDHKLVCTNLKSKTSVCVKVVNDYFGNLPALSAIIPFREGYWVQNISTEQLITNIEKRLTENSCTENDRLTLKKLRSSLNEENNNVVFIGKLKSEVKTNLW